jgi:hypothetical protein
LLSVVQSLWILTWIKQADCDPVADYEPRRCEKGAVPAWPD